LKEKEHVLMPAVATTPQTAQLPPHRVMVTVRQLAERHPAFSEAALRCLIYKAARNRGAVPQVSVLDTALRRVGRRVLIDEGRFLAWVDACTGGECM
jgi:hypothetical protein